MAAVRWLRRRVRGPRPQDEPTQVDGHACRPDLWFAFPAAGPGGSLCVCGREGEVCERLRGGVDQGDESRSLRPRLISAEATQTPRKPVPEFADLGHVASGHLVCCGALGRDWHFASVRADALIRSLSELKRKCRERIGSIPGC